MAEKFGLCLIVRDEVDSLIEWIAYHRMIGFDKIVIYDNKSTDGTSDLLACIANLELIEYVEWPSNLLSEHDNVQVGAYQHAARNQNVEWLCCLDADEFLVLEHANNISEWIDCVGIYNMPIALNWKVFGSGGAVLAEAGLVTDRFTSCGDTTHHVCSHIKTFGPIEVTNQGATVHIHGWPLADGQFYVDACGRPVDVLGHTFVSPPIWQTAWINHYIVKSQEEFKKKIQRGSATVSDDSPKKRTRNFENFFMPYDLNNNKCNVINKFRDNLITEIDYINKSILSNGSSQLAALVMGRHIKL